MIIIFIGLGMYLVGLICKYLHDDYKQYPNLFVGYRTRYAMKDKETWDEANSYIYKPCTFSFIVSLVVILGNKFLNVKLQNITYCILIFGITFGPIILTEIHLRRFNKNEKVS
ncbi:SdpI family protein (plasmid) [Paraclostridium ghonii]|uniref:SdpI family protein n=1 Tax=Paraclostridium ghonii TaxID=29358 RepID=UPI00202CCEA1|nr:SdpI family protein [Paeniclostridium ghonii]MCM0165410.1 SdpI family protein [Paeniclostridium ghonii]